MIYSAGLIVVMLYFPGGIAGALQRLATSTEAAAVTTLLEVRNVTPQRSARSGRCVT